MEAKEALELIQMIEAMYPSFMRGEPEVIKMKIQIWKEELLKQDYYLTKKKLIDYIRTNKFEPTLSEIRPDVRPENKVDFDKLGDLLGETDE